MFGFLCYVIGHMYVRTGTAGDESKFYYTCERCGKHKSINIPPSMRTMKKNQKSFRERYEAGDITDDQVDDMVDAWHSGDGNGKELHEYMGMSWEEYAEFVKGNFKHIQKRRREKAKRVVGRSRKAS